MEKRYLEQEAHLLEVDNRNISQQTSIDSLQIQIRENTNQGAASPAVNARLNRLEQDMLSHNQIIQGLPIDSTCRNIDGIRTLASTKLQLDVNQLGIIGLINIMKRGEPTGIIRLLFIDLTMRMQFYRAITRLGRTDGIWIRDDLTKAMAFLAYNISAGNYFVGIKYIGHVLSRDRCLSSKQKMQHPVQ